jgi:DNA primase
MARIPEDEVERLKREVSVQRLAEARGIKLHRHGADLLGLCPFHDDRNPSLVITPAKNLWHCLGACNAGGTAIDWVMKANGISFRHAVELLREDYLPVAAVPDTLESRPVKHGTVRKLPPPVARDADDRELLLQVVSYYNETLKQSPEAMKYLAEVAGDHRTLPAWLRQPDAGVPAAGEEPRRRRRDARTAANTGHPARERA